MAARATYRAAELRPFAGIADIGLHFTLTDLEPVGAAPILAPHGRFPPLSHVLRRLSLTRRLPQNEIRGAACSPTRCVRAGIWLLAGAFRRSPSRPPASGRAGDRPRSIAAPLSDGPTYFRVSHDVTNEGFRGIYDFHKERPDLTDLFDRFLQCPGSRMLICATPDIRTRNRRIDNLTTQRNAELAFR